MAALTVLCTPIFVVSGTTVMCDMLMVALWVWATYAWLRGCRQRSTPWLAISALGILLAALAKYFAVSLIPLLAFYALATRTPLRLWLRWLLLVAAALLAYQLWTKLLYGFGHLSDAGRFTSVVRSSIGHGPRYWVPGLTLLGGGMRLVRPPARWRLH
jgi:4-amino-4-deoxy-L-arabinose transferase-like glycosyltransferase